MYIKIKMYAYPKYYFEKSSNNDGYYAEEPTWSISKIFSELKKFFKTNAKIMFGKKI